MQPHLSKKSSTRSTPVDATFLRFNIPEIGEEEIAAVIEVLQSGWLTTGECTREFEEEFSGYVGVPHSLAVSSCTAALHLALVALGIGPGDEVITTPLTFCSTVNVILETGATPVLADIGGDLNIDPEAVRRLITPRTRAILPVHFAGLPCKMDAIWELASEYNLKVVEDAAHSIGALRKGDPGIGRSDAVAYSFYATKNLTTGEGGMVSTSSLALFDRMKVLCLHGISRDAWNRYTAQGSWYYEVVERGFKYNMSDLTAAIGIQQLRKLECMTVRRNQIADSFQSAFRHLPELEQPPVSRDCRHAWHLYPVRLHLDRLTIDRAQFLEEMREEGIGCSVHFIPIPLHPFYRRTLEMRDPCLRALSEYPRLLSLPLYPRMTDDDVRRVIQAVEKVAARASRPNSVEYRPYGQATV